MPKRITSKSLAERLHAEEPMILLDVRHQPAFDKKPDSLPQAVPLVLDVDDPRIPDLPRDTPVITFCLCSGEASSTRAALWLLNAGYQDVSVLIGGLPAWEAAGGETKPINWDNSSLRWQSAPLSAPTSSDADLANTTQAMLAETSFLAGQSLPCRRDLAVLFVDMVDSTPLLFRHDNERVLELVQAFMAVVVDTAVQHCGDVHDFEGDGAMLYFAGPDEALPAAFHLRSALESARQLEPELPLARLSVDAGPVVIGHIGTQFRRSLSFIGPCVNTAARLLKHAPVNGIAVTDAVYRHTLVESPELADKFDAEPERRKLKGFGDDITSVYTAPWNDCE
jgi:class 3 adenylate cyclase/rhodanese-related sulfurtransferase